MTKIPPFIYGTAWKETETARLTELAVLSGFKGIDTANQKKHYREDYVGEALLKLAEQGITRESLFLQSKYTYQRGQDHRLPYNPKDSFADQVKSSFASTLNNLHTNYLDSFLLHGPYSFPNLDKIDWEVWSAIEEIYDSGQTKMIGVSNFNVQQLDELCRKARIKPMIVQNRCYAEKGWDKLVREYCLEKNIIYQGFSLLTANQFLFMNPRLQEMATKHNMTLAQLVFRFTRHIGILPLTGTSHEQHMKEDLKVFDFELSQSEIDSVFIMSLDR